MKRICNLLLSFCLVLGLCACAGSATTWQEQYDLGVKYLSESNYEEAIIAFTAAIDIDPKRADSYIGLADAYMAQEDFRAALEILQQGFEQTGDERLTEGIDQAKQALTAAEAAVLIGELRPIVEKLDIPFVVDNVELNVTDISVPIAAYSGRPFAYSNLMNEDTENTVYTCFGMGGMPVPEGRYEMQFGFLFAGPAQGGPVHDIYINDESFTCMGAFRIGDDAGAVLELFGLQDMAGRLAGEIVFETEDGRAFGFHGDTENFSLAYCQDGREVSVEVVDGTVFSLNMGLTQK